MKTPKPIQLTNEEAIVLQQICENGEEDIVNLARSLRMNRHHVIHHLERLRQKGLITIQAVYGDWWVHTSNKGTRFLHYMWPEMTLSY